MLSSRKGRLARSVRRLAVVPVGPRYPAPRLTLALAAGTASAASASRPAAARAGDDEPALTFGIVVLLAGLLGPAAGLIAVLRGRRLTRL
jgi:hypothetical protein